MQMNVDEIRRLCLAFPETSEKLQWGDALCFKVRMKLFAVMGLDQVRLTFKCTPETFAELIEHEDIHPAPYLGHHNWVMLDRLDALPSRELQDLIQKSYAMVAAKAPPKKTIRATAAKKKASKKKSVGSRSRKN